MFAPGDVFNEFEALSKLLQQADQQPSGTKLGATPAGVGPHELLNVKVAAPRGRGERSDAQAAADAQQQAMEDPEDESAAEGRTKPSYEFVYKQAVETTDAFLGMSGKDPSSTCCEELLVAVQMPDVASAAEMDLDVRPTQLRLESKQYYLRLHLPHKVQSERGRAKWDAKKKILSVALPIIREDPF